MRKSQMIKLCGECPYMVQMVEDHDPGMGCELNETPGDCGYNGTSHDVPEYTIENHCECGTAIPKDAPMCNNCYEDMSRAELEALDALDAAKVAEAAPKTTWTCKYTNLSFVGACDNHDCPAPCLPF